MADVERCSAGWEWDTDEGEWVEVPPDLELGERLAVVYWHDESCVHLRDFKNSNYLRADQRFLPGKGLGRIIHVSDFITNATHDGRLTFPDRITQEDTRVIIKPGATGDPWWDTKQLLVQVERALDNHHKLYGPQVEAVFVFDQSSAHASFEDNALNAFDMNKSDSVKRKSLSGTMTLSCPITCPTLRCVARFSGLWSVINQKAQALYLLKGGFPLPQ